MEKNHWIETTERYIAFLDIMGFKNYVYRNSHDLVKKRMISLNEILNETEKQIHKISKQLNNIDDPIKTIIFSDSILLFSKDGSKDSLENILFTCQILLTECLEKKIPIKGAISFGRITADFEKSLFFGKGLIDAYELQDQLFMYGVILDEKVEKRLLPNKKFIDGYCSHCKVHTKSGKINHYTIDWPKWIETKSNFFKEKGKITPISVMENFYRDMSGYPRKYVDNTIEFCQDASGLKQ